LGSVAGQAIINQPQAAILSTESIRKRPVVVDDSVAIRPMMNLTMSFDHRIIDGLAASRFLIAVQSGLEEWTAASIGI
jgi:2-oxoisovalerate dehydrogenase E2 component (dihydrolipoyl transacylase)